MKAFWKVFGVILILALIVGWAPMFGQSAHQQVFAAQNSAPDAVWSRGDVFLGVSGGAYQVRGPDGTLKELSAMAWVASPRVAPSTQSVTFTPRISGQA